MGARDSRNIFSPLWQPLRHLKFTTAVTVSTELNVCYASTDYGVLLPTGALYKSGRN